jgi:hypothetical protein
MPYIDQSKRDLIDAGIVLPGAAGELNYQITMAVKKYFQTRGESYQTFNDAIGALEGAKLELYRRKIAPYEDKKIQANGDVY